MPNESAVSSDPLAVVPALQWRRIGVITAALTMAITVLAGGSVLASSCVTTDYAVTGSAPPTGNWADSSGALWTPAGGFPGCATGDTATDTNGSPTVFTVNSAIPNPIAGLNLSCNGCEIDIVSGGSLTLAGPGTIGSGSTLKVLGGTLTIASGTLTFHSGSQFAFSGGTIDIQNGGTVDFQTGSSGATTGGVMGGAGTLSISGGTLNIGAVTSPATFAMAAGILTGPGFLSIGQQFNWDGGTLMGSGGTELAGGGQGSLSGGIGPMVLDGRTFNNYGYIHYHGATNPLQLSNGATFNNYFTFEIDDDGPINGTAPASFNVYPNGLLWKVGGSGGTTTIYPQVTNNANVYASTGTLEFAGNSTNSGLFFAFSPATIKFSAASSVFDASSGIGGDGTIKFSAGTSQISGDYDVDNFSVGGGRGLTDICGGSVDIESSGFTNDLKFSSGTLTVNGDFTMGGLGTWSGGTMNATNPDAYFAVAFGATLTIDAATSSPTDDFLIFANDGTVNYTANATSGNYLTFANDAIADNTGLFDMQTDAQIASTGGVIIIGDSKTANASALARRGRAAKPESNDAATEARARRLATASANAAKRGKPHVLAGCGCPVTNEFDNSGTVQKSGGSGASGTDFGPDFVNGSGSYAGVLKALSGKINFLGAFEQDGSSSETTLGGGNIGVASGLELNAGALDGSGTITGDLDNYGSVNPGTSSTTGVINVTGNYLGGSAGAGGTLTIKLAGPAANQFDQLNVTGTATIDGTLDVSLLGGYEPANGATFPAMTYASLSGDFTTKNLPPPWASGHGTLATNPTPTAYNLVATVTPSSADLDADLLSGPANVDAGTALSYTIKVGQNGPDSISGTVTVVDTLPAGVTGASGSGSGWTCGLVSGGTITCTYPGPVPTGQMNILTFSMTAPSTGGVITDSATVSSATNDPSPSNNSKSVNTTVVEKANLAITKTGPSGVTAGQNVTYTVIVTNNGPQPSVGVVVSDTTPSNLTFVSNSNGCTSAYPCSLGTLTPGQSVTITSTYSTSPSFSGNVSNTATVAATTSDPNLSDNTATATTNVGAQADLSVVKSGPSSTNPGQIITYTVVVTNGGPSPATSVVVTDPTPVGIAFISNTGACTNAYPCNISSLASGQSATITSTYSVPPTYSGGAIVNTATASSAVNDPNNTNNSSTVTTTVGASADVAIAKSGPATATPGTNITYTITVSNFGPAGATGVVVSDPTPAGLTFVSASGGGCTSFPCTIGALAVGPPVTITAIYSIPVNYAGASITNTASVSSASDPNATNNTSSSTATISAQSDLSITKSGPASVAVGTAISYTITVTNSGTIAAANTFVNDATPAGLTFVSNSGGCSGPFPCALGTVNSGASVVITSTYNVPANYAGSSISNTAAVSTSSPESNTSNNSSTATTSISGTGVADLAVTKSGPATATTNDPIDFTVSIKNNGPSPATNVIVSDPTPSGLSFISNSGACSTPYPCTITSIASGGVIAITSHYSVTATSGTVTNTASVTSSQTDPLPANNSAAVAVVVSPVLVCPTAPVLTVPANGATVGSPVIFSWNGSTGAASYVLSLTTNGTTQTIPTATATLTKDLANGSYTWSVQAIGNAGCPNTTSSTFSFTVCNNPGAPVPSVVGLSMTGQTYAVSWTPLEGVTQYELQESLDAAFSSPASTMTASSSISFTRNVQTATAFFYRVRAVASCNPVAGPFSATAPIVIVPISSLGSTGPNIVVPAGSTQPVTFPLQVPGLPGGSTSFIASVDKPWLAVTPTSGIMPPEGLTFTISADPSSLQNGTWTSTVIIVFGSTSVNSRIHTEDTAKTSIPVSISLTTPVSPGTQTSPASSAVVIPSVGHLAGLGSQWQSDIRIANITAFSKKVQLTFNQGSASSSAVKQTTLSIDPGATTALDDIVRNWFGVGALGDSSNGVLTVQPLDAAGKPDTNIVKATVASSRTFNASALGTLGQFIPAVPIPNFISTAAGANAILALQQIAQSDTFRTNLGIVEATGKPASALVSVFDGAGSRLLDLPLTIAAGEQRQLNSFLADKGITLTNGHIEVQATGGDGKLTAYASVIDSRTTDPLLVSGVPIGGAGATRFVIPGVASLDTGATWRSDVRIFNGGNTPQTATLTLFPTGNPSASVVSSVTIQPGEVKALDDIVHATFNLTNAGGALHVTTSIAAPLIVTARTYDQTSTGTLGQFLQAVTPADAVGVSDRALQLLQMEDSPRYRTNLGLAEVTGKAVTAEVTVILPDSKVAPKVQIPLGAFEYRQFPIISSLGLGNTYNARISVKVIDGQGKVTAYGSVIDQKTQDPTFVPAQ
jgi:uncharacterized repeat protein (TIGR01451 family)